jgi:hypothetical protein
MFHKKTKDEKEKELVAEEHEKHPELDAEIMILDPLSNIIQIDHVYAKDKTFKHDGEKTEYKLKPKGLNLIPFKDTFVAHYLFKKGESEPYDFTNKNKRIPARVLTILYNLDAYRILICPERKNLNLILVIVGIVTLVVLGIYAWLNYGHGALPNLGHLVGGH